MSVLFLMIAGAADAGGELLDWTVGGLMGLCAAVGLGMFGVGFVAMRNLWKEVLTQLKSARIFKLVVSAPLAIFYLAAGVGVFVLLGFFIDKIPKGWGTVAAHPVWGIGGAIIGAVIVGVLGEGVWHVIAEMFGALWGAKGHAALVSRLILMVLFSTIMISAAVFILWWAADQIAPLQVIVFCVMSYANVMFYSRWVRFEALRGNLEQPPAAAG